MAKKENNSLESKEKKDMIKAFDSPIMNKIAETFYLEAQARLEESKCRGIEIKEKEETQRKALEVQQEDNKFNYEYGKKALNFNFSLKLTGMIAGIFIGTGLLCFSGYLILTGKTDIGLLIISHLLAGAAGFLGGFGIGSHKKKKND